MGKADYAVASTESINRQPTGPAIGAGTAVQYTTGGCGDCEWPCTSARSAPVVHCCLCPGALRLFPKVSLFISALHHWAMSCKKMLQRRRRSVIIRRMQRHERLPFPIRSSSSCPCQATLTILSDATSYRLNSSPPYCQQHARPFDAQPLLYSPSSLPRTFCHYSII